MIVCLGTTPAVARTMEFGSLRLDGVNRALRVQEYAAGKAVNAARAIATLGEPVTCISTAGGSLGERLRQLATSEKVEHVFVPVRSPSRGAVTVIDRANSTSTELVEESGPLTPDEGENLLARLKEQLSTARVCVLAGSVAPGLDQNFLAQCVQAASSRGVATIVDASAGPLQAAINERPTVIKINVGELATVTPIDGEGEAAIAKAAQSLTRRTGGWVIVTRGGASTIAVNSMQAISASVPAVKVVGAIGSGDSFTGAVAVAIHREMAMEDAIRLATACASANAMTADAAHFDVKMVESLRAHVQITSTAS